MRITIMQRLFSHRHFRRRILGVLHFLLDYLLLLITWALVGATSGKSLVRYADQPFPTKNLILNQTVTCESFIPGKFVAKTFTCSRLRVDGHLLAYGHYHGWAIGEQDRRCQDTDGVHEFGQLCRLLLKQANLDHLGFKAVYIPNSTCGYLDDTRKLLRKVSDDRFKWLDLESGWGYTETIQCMTTTK